MDSNHECKIIPQDYQVTRYERSAGRWELKRNRVGEKNYSCKAYMDWIDPENIVVSHFGLHPNQLQRDKIRFDVFYLRGAVIRQMMGNLQKLLIVSNMGVESSK